MKFTCSSWVCCGKKVLRTQETMKGLFMFKSLAGFRLRSGTASVSGLFTCLNKTPGARTGMLLAKAQMVISNRGTLETNGFHI